MAMHRATKSEIDATPRRARRKGPGRHTAGVPLSIFDDLPAAPVEVAIADETLEMPSIQQPSPFDDIIAREAAVVEQSSVTAEASDAASTEDEAPAVAEAAPIHVDESVVVTEDEPAADATPVIVDVNDDADSIDVVAVDEAVTADDVIDAVEAFVLEEEVSAGEVELPTTDAESDDVIVEPTAEVAEVAVEPPADPYEPELISTEPVTAVESDTDLTDAGVVEPIIDEQEPPADLVVAEMVMGEVAPAPQPDPAKEVHIHHHYHEAAEQQAPQVIIAAGPPVIVNEWPTNVPVAPLPDRAPREPSPAAYDYADYEPEEYPTPVRPERPAKPAKKTKKSATPTTRAPLPEKDPIFTWRGRPIGKKYQEQAPYIPEQRAIEAAPADRPEPRRRADRRAFVSAGIDPTDWFQNTVLDAIHRGASDLHVRVEENTAGTTDILTARLRIDGRMRHLETIEGEEARVILNKFKAQAELSTNGSYVPEETIYEVEVDGEIRKARVALFRTAAAGDALVLRLPSAGPLLRLEDLNFAPHNEQLVNSLLHASNRMLMIAGPMGSGKTTTAHAALQKVTTGERSVWSLEDPVERDLPGVTQLEVDEENGAGFDTLLPVLVRSDYDTLFLGEIRDNATASAGVRQAKAGRQVITTIHANDNVTALYRLIELAKDSPLSVLDSVVGVISQRLVGRLNPDWDGANMDEKYKGRVPIHEVLRITPQLIEAVMRDAPMTEVQKIAAATSESTFIADGQRLVGAGITDKEEVFRVLGYAG